MGPQVSGTGQYLQGSVERLGWRRDSSKKDTAALLIAFGVLLAFGVGFVLMEGLCLFLTYR
jgi:hypothetical protein